MYAACKALRKRVKRLAAAVRSLIEVRTTTPAEQPVYLDPVDYAREVLGVILTPQQAAICRALREYPWRVLVPSANNQGKTFLAAVLVNWWFDTFRANSAVITTAPSAEHVTSVLWGEVRTLRTRAGLPGFETRAVAPLLYESPTHYAKGIATDRGERLKGRHLKHMLFVVDEAVGVEPWVYEAIRTMFQSDGLHAWLLIGNPTDTTSAMYAEEQRVGLDDAPVWRVMPLSAVDHPNVELDLHQRGRKLHGLPPLETARVPGAVSLDQFEQWLAAGADPLPAGDANQTDLQWPPEWYRAKYTPAEPERWWRCGPEMEAVGLGRWPSQNSGSVWSQAAWESALVRKGELDGDGKLYDPETSAGPRYFPGELIGVGELKEVPVISCDPARKGTNKTDIKVRVGPHVLHSEEHSGWEAPQTVGRLKELAREWADWSTARRHVHAAPVEALDIRVIVDSDGLGSPGVIDWANPGWQSEFTFVPLSAASPPIDPARYLNKRSELWFHAVSLARTGKLDLSRLPKKILAKMRQQAMAPQWKFDGLGHRVVETKEHMQERGVVSPDSMDALNLLVYPSAGTMTIETEKGRGNKPRPEDYADDAAGWDDAEPTSDRPAHYRPRRE